MVIALAGRRIDAPGTDSPRFPLANIEMVRKRILAFFREHKVHTVVCSAACGADLLALEVADALAVRRRVVLPFAKEQFRRTSVTDRPGSWDDSFTRITTELEKYGDLVVLDYHQNDEDAYTATNQVILEQARLLSTELSQKLGVVLVWDSSSRTTEDVTAAFGELATSQGIPVWEISTLTIE